MYCIIKCIVQGKQACVKNADLRHPSCTVLMQKRKSASPVLNGLTSNSFSDGQDKTRSSLNRMFHKGYSVLVRKLAQQEISLKVSL